MPVLAAAVALVLLAAAVLGLVRRERAHAAELEGLSALVRDLSQRLESAEQDLARVQTQADVTESLLVEKGVADEEDVEAVRARFDGEAAAEVRTRDDDLH